MHSDVIILNFMPEVLLRIMGGSSPFNENSGNLMLETLEPVFYDIRFYIEMNGLQCDAIYNVYEPSFLLRIGRHPAWT